MPDHSYVTIRSRLSASVQDILASVTEKLQYSEEQSTRGDALILVTMASSGGARGLGVLRAGLGGPARADPTLCPSAEKAVLQPSEECVFTTLGINSHLFACTRDTFDSLVSPAVGTARQGPPITCTALAPRSLLAQNGGNPPSTLSALPGVLSQVPLPEEIQVVPGDTEIHRAEPEDVANHLTAFHWELFRCIHEVWGARGARGSCHAVEEGARMECVYPPQLEFVDYVFHGERGRRETANLELLLQRCSEVQHWVGTELLLCEGLGKRAHLLKKLIKIAAM